MKVAILEDEAPQAELALATLQASGHTCVWFKAGQALLTKLRRETFDLLVLDWNVPQVSGLEIAAWARANLKPTPPILMLTARTGSDDVVAALNAGADDFIVKPVEPAVLTARVNALLRRAYAEAPTSTTQTHGPYTFDPLNLTATWAGGEARMTAKEYALALVFSPWPSARCEGTGSLLHKRNTEGSGCAATLRKFTFRESGRHPANRRLSLRMPPIQRS